jgi:hypothetical protein
LAGSCRKISDLSKDKVTHWSTQRRSFLKLVNWRRTSGSCAARMKHAPETSLGDLEIAVAEDLHRLGAALLTQAACNFLPSRRTAPDRLG